MRRLLLILTLGLMMVSGSALAQETVSGTPQAICDAATPAPEPETRTFEQPGRVLEAGVDYRAVLCTEEGPVYVDLLENYAPETVNNFVFLAQNDYYNNTTFHRVLADFMAQAGDPTGTGGGGPGYQFRDEFLIFMTFDRPGLLAMANANRPEEGIVGTNGSQFFVTTVVTDWLTYRHTIFGDVLEGMENVESLRLRDPNENPDFEGATLETVVIITDPSQVESSADTSIDITTAEQIDTELLPLTEALPENLSFIEASGIYTTEEVISNAPEGVQADYSAYLDEYGHQYRVVQGLNNDDCTEDYFFSTMSYTLEAFADEEAARDAVNAGFLNTLNEAEGFNGGERSETWFVPVYTRSETACGDADGTRVRGYFLRGPYVATVEALVTAELAAEVEADRLLNQGVAQIFEQFLATTFRPVTE